MSNWTLTPDGLKTDDQLWAEEVLERLGKWCPHCHNDTLAPGLSTTLCTLPPHVDANVAAAIVCTKCWMGWCKECLGED